MKRGAEKQLSKDDNPDDEVEEVQTGFQVAKESELERREIRGLPKRRSPAVALVSPPGTTQPGVPQRFGSFSGFGASTGGATSFTLASSPLGGPPQKPTDAPAVSESASNATKKFASFLGPPTAGTKSAVSSSETPKQDAPGDTDEVALRYYTSLRGLNSCFLSAISKAIESDPFVDIADLLEQYKKHRVSVQHDYDGKSSHARTQNAPSPPSKPSVPAAPTSFLKPSGSTPATMPVPPSVFSGFGPFPDSLGPSTGFTPSAAGTANPSPFSLSSTATASSDPKPVSAASSSPFSGFGSSPSPFKSPASHASKEAESSTPSLNPSSLGAFASSGTSNPFSLGASATSTPSTSTLLFGNPPNPPKTSTLFGFDKVAPEEKDKEKDKPASSAPPTGPFAFSLAPGANIFGDASTSLSGSSNIFGASTTTKSADERDNKDNKEKDKPAAAAPPTSVFGGAPFGAPSKPFTFGSAASATTPAQFGFGVAPGAGGKGSSPPPKAGSVGFSFGSPSRTSSQAASTTAPGAVFGFWSASTVPTSASGPAAAAGGGAAGGTADSTPASTNASTPAPAPASAVSALLDPSSAAASRSDTPATEGSLEEDGLARMQSQSPGLHGGEGEGEEDEETTYTVKAKVFKFTKDREDVLTWHEMGIGMLRLKKHKETDARRVILRSSTTGKIFINFRIYSGLQPKRTGKTVAFTGHITADSRTESAQYRLRVASEAAATELVEAMEREVRLVQTNSSPST